jgi:hypothetical protein
MMAALMSQQEGLDKTKLGPIVLEFLARSLERGLAARQRSDPSRFVDVDYREFVADPMASVKEIYRAFHLEFSAATERTMQEYVTANPQKKHGTHRYSMDEYGLTPEQVRARLRFYIDRFDLPADV